MFWAPERPCGPRHRAVECEKVPAARPSGGSLAARPCSSTAGPSPPWHLRGAALAVIIAVQRRLVGGRRGGRAGRCRRRRGRGPPRREAGDGDAEPCIAGLHAYIVLPVGTSLRALQGTSGDPTEAAGLSQPACAFRHNRVFFSIDSDGPWATPAKRRTKRRACSRVRSTPTTCPSRSASRSGASHGPGSRPSSRGDLVAGQQRAQRPAIDEA